MRRHVVLALFFFAYGAPHFGPGKGMGPIGPSKDEGKQKPKGGRWVTRYGPWGVGKERVWVEGEK